MVDVKYLQDAFLKMKEDTRSNLVLVLLEGPRSAGFANMQLHVGTAVKACQCMHCYNQQDMDMQRLSEDWLLTSLEIKLACLQHTRMYHIMLCCAVLCCAVLCCAVLCCAVPRCATHDYIHLLVPGSSRSY